MYQQILIIGNLGRDPEMRYMPDGRPVANLSVATNRSYTSASGEQCKETTWFRVSVFGKQAEACNQYLSKGRPVLVEGRLQADKDTGGPRIWKGQDGEPRASFEIVANTVRFLGGRTDSNGNGGAAQGEQAQQHGQQVEHDINDLAEGEFPF